VDGKVTLKKASFLGWCVNDGPGLMLKKTGTAEIVPITGALKMEDLSKLTEIY